MSPSITGIERDIVINYLIQAQEPLFLYSRSNNSKSFLLEQDSFSIIQKKIIFFTPAVLNSIYEQDLDKTFELPFSDARVRFFYYGRGLFFDTTIKKTRNGFAFTIPLEIQKMADIQACISKGCSGSFYYSGEDNPPIPCVPLEGFPCFELYTNKKKKEESCQEYVLQAVRRFLISEEISHNAVKDRAEPFFILAITDASIVFGIKTKTILLQQEESYHLELKIPAGVINRSIKMQCKVKKLYDNEKKASSYCEVAVCDFINVKIEDERFLYEQYFGKKCY